MEGKSDLKKYGAYIFDLDGTLFTVPVDWKKVRKEIAEIGVPLEDSISLFKQLARLQGNTSLMEQVFRIIDRHEVDSLGSASPREGAVSVLQSLNRDKFLVTMQGREFCTMLLDKFSISDLFKEVVTREFSLQRVRQLSYCISISREKDMLFVGDKEDDALSSIMLGIDFAAAPGYKGKIKPTYLLSSLTELID